MESTATATTTTDPYFPSVGTSGVFQRALLVLRKRWIYLLSTSTLAICLWYVIAIGIRVAFDNLSMRYMETKTFEMGGEEIAFQWQSFRTTFSRLGLCVEFLLVFLLHMPADAINIRLVAELYAGSEKPIVRQVLRSVVPCLLPLTITCLCWCGALLLPLLVLIAWMGPEGQDRHEGLELLYLPLWPKIIGGGLFVIFSTIFMVVTYYAYSLLVIGTTTRSSGIASLQQSYEMSRSSSSWLQVLSVSSMWFLMKLGITKFVSALNLWYYGHEKHFWLVWDEQGIPIHPGRILWSSMDLWEVGRSWISVPFVIALAAIGSV